jgi:hypothetical protein
MKAWEKPLLVGWLLMLEMFDKDRRRLGGFGV